MLAADNAPAVNEAKPTVWVFPTAKLSKHPLVRVWQLLWTRVRVPLFQSDFDPIGFGILDDEIWW